MPLSPAVCSQKNLPQSFSLEEPFDRNDYATIKFAGHAFFYSNFPSGADFRVTPVPLSSNAPPDKDVRGSF